MGTVPAEQPDSINTKYHRSYSMIIKKRRNLIIASAFAAMLASASSAAIARAAGYAGGDDGGDDSSFKSAACGLIGCANGNRVCGTAGGTIKAGIPPFVGEVSVEYTCYENPLL
jgi:hypothetical protein